MARAFQACRGALKLDGRLVQSPIELSQAGAEERALLESLSNHIGARGPAADRRQAAIAFDQEA
jgi:hypothetical protein